MNKRISVVVVLLVFFSLVSVVGFSQYVTVTIRSGWTLWDIAKDFNMSVLELMEINNLKNSTIYPGQNLRIIPYENSPAVVSWYGADFQGKKMANGERFDRHDSTVVAHKWLPLGTEVKLTRVNTDRNVTVTVQDRGPYVEGRNFDLSKAAAEKLGMIDEGVIRCEVKILS